jgi:RNA recognition motif-containing protein
MGKQLYVTNISFQATEDDIRRMFSVAGTVRSVKTEGARVRRLPKDREEWLRLCSRSGAETKGTAIPWHSREVCPGEPCRKREEIKKYFHEKACRPAGFFVRISFSRSFTTGVSKSVRLCGGGD